MNILLTLSSIWPVNKEYGDDEIHSYFNVIISSKGHGRYLPCQEASTEIEYSKSINRESDILITLGTGLFFISLKIRNRRVFITSTSFDFENYIVTYNELKRILRVNGQHTFINKLVELRNSNEINWYDR